MRLLGSAALVAALMLGTTVRAETYRWVGSDGTHHFTQDASRVPAAQRAQARVEPSRSIGSYTGPSGASAGLGPNVVRYESEGHLIKVKVRLNGRITVPFYVDTGSTELVLPESVARRLGRPTRGEPVRSALLETPAGRIRVPALRLETVQLGEAEASDLFATVAPGLEVGLLGGAFLNHFRYAIDPVEKTLTLIPRGDSTAP